MTESLIKKKKKKKTKKKGTVKLWTYLLNDDQTLHEKSTTLESLKLHKKYL